MQPYTVGIVDDSYQIISSLSDELSATEQVTIILKARNGEDFLQQLKKIPDHQHPQVVLMDIDMPLMNGIDAVRYSSILYGHIKFIMLTVFDDDDKLFDAIHAGAGGYLLKEEQPASILKAIKELLEGGGAPMSPRIARKTLDFLTNKNKTNNLPVETNLSERELDILKGLVNGDDYKQIAGQLFISPNTVRNHISKIYEKLHITSKAQAVKIAIKNNWV